MMYQPPMSDIEKKEYYRLMYQPPMSDIEKEYYRLEKDRLFDELNKTYQSNYAKDWKVGDKPWVLQFGFGKIIKIDYTNGDVWVDTENIHDPCELKLANMLPDLPDESYCPVNGEECEWTLIKEQG